MTQKGKEVLVKEETCAAVHSAPDATLVVVSESAVENSAPPTGGDTAAPKNTVILRSSDGQEFEVEVLQAMGSETIKNIIEDGCAGTAVPLPNVTGDVLAMVVQYWRRHAQGDEGSEELKQWDKEFADMDDHDERFDIILAANYLGAKPLLDLLCQAVADTIKDFTVEQVREYFDIENDFTPEEEAKFREENKWAFD